MNVLMPPNVDLYPLYFICIPTKFISMCACNRCVTLDRVVPIVVQMADLTSASDGAVLCLSKLRSTDCCTNKWPWLRNMSSPADFAI